MLTLAGKPLAVPVLQGGMGVGVSLGGLAGAVAACGGMGCICSKGAILAVILHPKGKAMDSASISFRQEQGLMLRKGQDFPNSFHSG